MKNPIFDISGIMKYLHSGWGVCPLDCVDSTNNTAKNMLAERAITNVALVAREQSAGRGRYTRKFASPRDCGVYFSAILTPKSEDEVLFMTPLVAIAVCEAVSNVCQKDAKIKWVNDILVDGKKCCGILCERVRCGEEDRVVLGIGIDLLEPEGGYDEEIKNVVCAVGEGIDDVGNRIVARTLDNIAVLHEMFAKERIVKWYKQKSCVIGKLVTVCKPDEQSEAKAIDIDNECRLVVEYTNGEVEHLSFGEVRIKC